MVSQLTFICSKLAIVTLEKGEICSKLTIKTPERSPFSSVSIVGVEQVNVSWAI